MKSIFLSATTLIMLLSVQVASAAINCSVSSSGFSTSYLATSMSSNVTQGSIDLSCSRDSFLDGTTTNYTIALNNGLNATGTQNNAALGPNKIPYDIFPQSGCTGTTFSGSANNRSITNINFWGCITALGLYVPTGLYTDTVSVVVTYSGGFLQGNKTTNTSLPVNVTNIPICKINNNFIDNVAFGNYQAFRATPLVAPNANVGITCNPNLGYSLSLDANSGVIAGLNYTLTLNPISSIGSGVVKTHTISGSMPANQAGTCSTGTCSDSNQRTLTITY